MLIRVLEIPSATGRFHFGGSESQIFLEVDWFRDEDTPIEKLSYEEWVVELTTFIKSKNYYKENAAYLVLHPTKTFTINYKAP